MLGKYLLVKIVVGAFLVGVGGKLVGLSQMALDVEVLHHPLNMLDGYFVVFGGVILLIEGLHMFSKMKLHGE